MDAHPVPLLLVHGGWCWDDHVLDFFADAGHRAALSLRGHGTSPTPKPVA